jgi:hypothetical protein
MDEGLYNKSWWEEFRRAEVDRILELTGKKNSDYTGGIELTGKKNSDYTGGKSCDNPFENFDGSTEFGIDVRELRRIN